MKSAKTLVFAQKHQARLALHVAEVADIDEGGGGGIPASPSSRMNTVDEDGGEVDDEVDDEPLEPNIIDDKDEGEVDEDEVVDEDGDINKDEVVNEDGVVDEDEVAVEDKVTDEPLVLNTVDDDEPLSSFTSTSKTSSFEVTPFIPIPS